MREVTSAPPLASETAGHAVSCYSTAQGYMPFARCASCTSSSTHCLRRARSPHTARYGTQIVWPKVNVALLAAATPSRLSSPFRSSALPFASGIRATAPTEISEVPTLIAKSSSFSCFMDRLRFYLWIGFSLALAGPACTSVLHSALFTGPSIVHGLYGRVRDDAASAVSAATHQHQFPPA